MSLAVNDTTPPTPLACYRPAKLGIFHHAVAVDSSRFSLKVLKREDWIVATFAAYFRMKLGNHRPSSNTEVPDSATAGLPISTSMPVLPRWQCLAHSSLSLSPLTQALVRSPPKLSSSSTALATLQVLRRINKNYGRGSKAVIDFPVKLSSIRKMSAGYEYTHYVSAL